MSNNSMQAGIQSGFTTIESTSSNKHLAHSKLHNGHIVCTFAKPWDFNALTKTKKKSMRKFTHYLVMVFM